ncbi:MAG: cobalt-precorrin-5B (C(1))-methyltransferase CbiD [Actinomycetota bacterium]
MSTSEPELSPDVAAAKGLRTGWTTGTCASAAARAAAEWLVTGAAPEAVEVGLPSGDRVSFPTADVDPDTPHRVAIIKDAGDDPDCTDGAHVTAQVAWAEDAAPADVADGADTGRAVTADHDADANGGTDTVTLLGGDGVGTVTKPGLGLPVGGPAINPVPARMIRAAIAEVTDRPVVCTISVPGGQKMAEKTSNARLGIEGGISILGTTGIVKPFSTASYRASVVQQIDVAAAQRLDTVVLATGSRSDRWAQEAWPDLPPVAFVEVGDFTGIALRRAAGDGIAQVRFVGMAGKIAKLAAGVMMTHFHRSKVDTDLLETVAKQVGAGETVVAAATETNTARHFAEVCLAENEPAALTVLCEMAAERCRAHTGDELAVTVTMVDFAGEEEIARG